METTNQTTYLKQVFNSTFFTVVMAILAVALVYSGSLLLFANWAQYDDPIGSKGNAIGVFVIAAVVLSAAFLVPYFQRDKVFAPRTQGGSNEADPSGFVPGQSVAYIGPLSEGLKIYGIYRRPAMYDGQLIVSLDGGLTEESVQPYHVYQN